MKTYACLKCGRTLESSEFVREKKSFAFRRSCPSCGASLSLSGATLMVIGFLWAVVFVVIPTPETEWTGIGGGGLLLAVGIVRMILQLRARRNANKALHATAAAPRG